MTRMPPSFGTTRILVGLLLVCWSMLPVSSSAQSGDRYKVRLSTVPVDFVTAPNIAGSGSATAVLTGTKLVVTGTFDGLISPATVARIHRGPLGIRGPAVLDLTVSGNTAGTIAGSLELKANQIEDLKQQRLYVQLHSEKAPEGNLWGWFRPQEP